MDAMPDAIVNLVICAICLASFIVVFIIFLYVYDFAKETIKAMREQAKHNREINRIKRHWSKIALEHH